MNYYIWKIKNNNMDTIDITIAKNKLQTKTQVNVHVVSDNMCTKLLLYVHEQHKIMQIHEFDQTNYVEKTYEIQ